MDANLVDPRTLQPRPVREVVSELVGRLRGVAAELGCAGELAYVLTIAEQPTGAQRQLATFRETGDLAEVVRRTVYGR
jgi:carboxylate-amine ligase